MQIRIYRKLTVYVLLLTVIVTTSYFTIPKSISLFNGKDLAGWHMDVPVRDSVRDAPEPFIVRDGMLVSLGKPVGHLITNDAFENYRLTVEYRFPGKPGNSGVLLHVSTLRIIYKTFPRSIESQLQHLRAGDFNCMGEDITVPDMESRRGPRNQWGTTPDKRYSIKKLTDSAEFPVGQWNTMEIECVDRSITIWVNKTLVNQGYDCTTSQGQIALQSEGTPMEFRKVTLTPLRGYRRMKPRRQ